MTQFVWYKRPGVDGDKYIPQILDVDLPEDYNRDVFVAVYELKRGENELSYEELMERYPSPPQPEAREMPKDAPTPRDDQQPPDPVNDPVTARFTPSRTV